MPNTNDLTVSKYVKALVYGQSKVFKTGGACTFPRPNVMDFDHGIGIVRHPNFVKQYGNLSIEYEQFNDSFNSHGIPQSHKAFDSACLYFDKWMKPDKVDKFDTWVIDSGTALSRAAMHKAVILLGSKDFAAAKSTTHDSAQKFGLLVPKLQDYGAERSMVEQFVTMVLSAQKHVIFICHERQVVDDAGALVEVTPLLTGKSVASVGLMFDEVWNIRRQRKGTDWLYVVQTEYDGIRTCGSRTGIPNGCQWNWPAVNSAIEEIKAQQQAATAKEAVNASSTT